jgi:hypothetical protein
MNSLFKLFASILFLFVVIFSVSAQPFYVSGTVRYLDNNEIVTQGVVAAFNSQGTLEATCAIGNQGDYLLCMHRAVHGANLIGFPNIEPEMEDFLPTGYPDKLNPAEFVQIDVTQNLSGIDIYVHRNTTPGNSPSANNTVKGIVLSDNVPVSHAIVYAKFGNDYVAFGVTNSNGEYSIKNLLSGDYILVAHKIGSISEYKPVTINPETNSIVNFSLSKINSNLTVTNPYEFSLMQNYPNPFNPSTSISYSVAKEGLVTLKVYNLSGQLVAELVNNFHQPGIYNVDFDASGLSSGIYFCRMDAASGFSAVNKMILVK